MSQEKRKAPEVYDYYGQPIYYRLENRDSGLVINLSIRIGADPATGRKGTILGRAATWKLSPEDQKDIQQALFRMVPKLLIKRLSINKEDGLCWREKGDGCTLGVVWTIDFPILAEHNGWNRETCQRHQRTMAQLIKKYGEMPLKEFVPTDLGEELDTVTQDQIRLLRRLFELEWPAFGLEENPWLDAGLSVRRSVRSHAENLRDNLRIKDLTMGQCAGIVRLCLKNCDSGSGSYYLAVLFLLLVGLGLDELYGLRWGDVVPLRYYLCMTIRISGVGVRPGGGKRYKRIDVLTGPRHRVLAIPDLLVWALDQRRTYLLQQGVKPEKLGSLPILGDPKNYGYPITPEKMKKWVKKHIGPLLDRTVEYGAAIPPYRQLQITAQRNLIRCGFEEDEVQYQLGHRPKTTAAMYYNDFASEHQLFRRHCLQKRWMAQLPAAPLSPPASLSPSPPAPPSSLKREKGRIVYNCDPGCRPNLNGRIVIPPLSADDIRKEKRLQKEGFRLAVFCEGGFYTGTIRLREIDDKGK